MSKLIIEYPAEVLWALQQEPDEFAAEARLLLALKLYEVGKLSTRLAAQIAGVPRTTFFYLLGSTASPPLGKRPMSLKRISAMPNGPVILNDTSCCLINVK